VRRNLELEPFNFPEPIYLIPEMIKKEIPGGNIHNNYMGVWEIEKL
jgi:hypothetical protein